MAARSIFGTFQVVWPMTKLYVSSKSYSDYRKYDYSDRRFRKKNKKTKKKTRKKTNRRTNSLPKLNTVIYYRVTSGAIIGDGNLKQVLFLVLQLSLLYGNFLYFSTNCAIMCGTREYTR